MVHREVSFFKLAAAIFAAFISAASAEDLAISLADGEARFSAPSAESWRNGEKLALEVSVPPLERGALRLVAFMKDRDGNWFQTIAPTPLAAGTNSCVFDWSAESREWEASGHKLLWNYRVRLAPQFVGAKLFAEDGGTLPTNGVEWSAAKLLPRADSNGAKPPTPENLRYPRFSAAAISNTVPVRGLYELSFDLPDRYADPFDPAQIAADAQIVTPQGTTNSVPCFYFQDFYRLSDSAGERCIPQGRPEWRLRYSPPSAGEYKVTLRARDALGEGMSEERTFFASAETSEAQFVRVSRKNPRFLALDDGEEFFPIGHNIRSPFDACMDEQFPFHLRHPRATSHYKNYFAAMRDAGENLTEIWMCQWSLGLEWSEVSPGYHGCGDYHLANAWELDGVFSAARAAGIRVNLVLNNHGRAGLGYDAEWKDSPYNIARGGFLPADDPMSFFSDARAKELQKRICRYIVARWSWDSTVFAWELWSELDLCGKFGQKVAPQFDPAVIAWHAEVGGYIKSIDPNKHLVSTHLSANWHITSDPLAFLPELDLCAIDAYHFNRDPRHIAHLVVGTAERYARFNKPVLITEFGGSSMAAGATHLERELHTALWSGTCQPLAGTPLFWWWQFIEEWNLYPEFTAIENFTRGFDRASAAGNASFAIAGEKLRFVGMATPTNLLAYAWGMPPATFAWRTDTPGIYRVSFHSTTNGLPLLVQDLRSEGGTVSVALPNFTNDIAIKAFRLR